MRVVPNAVVAAFLAVSLSACGAGEPQTDEIRENSQPGGVIVSSTSGEARQYFADGMREWDYNRVPEAHANFKQASSVDPGFTLAYIYAAETAQKAAEQSALRAEATRASANASEYERLIAQAMERRWKNDAQGALQLLQSLTEKYADNARAWELRAFVLGEEAFFEESRASYEKAIAADSLHPSYYMYLAASLTFNQPTDFARAESLLKKAIELEPNESYIHDLLGDTYRMTGRLELAAAEYTKAAELDPTAGGPLQQRGHVNALMGRSAEARADYDASVATAKGNFKIGYGLYRPFVHLLEGNARAAITEQEALYKSIESSDAEEPDGLRALILADMVLIASHNRMLDVLDRVEKLRAEVRARRIAQINTPEFREQEARQVELESGFAAAYRGNFAKAEQHAENYRKLRESEIGANKLWPYYNLRGTIAFLQGRNDEAIKLLAQSNPNNIYLTYLTAVAHERAGRKAEAKAEYEKVVKHNFLPAALALVRREAEAKVKAL